MEELRLDVRIECGTLAAPQSRTSPSRHSTGETVVTSERLIVKGRPASSLFQSSDIVVNTPSSLDHVGSVPLTPKDREAKWGSFSFKLFIRRERRVFNPLVRSRNLNLRNADTIKRGLTK